MEYSDSGIARPKPGRAPDQEGRMLHAIPARLSPDGTTATWNPAGTRASRVRVRVRLASGAVEERETMNSGRARVRAGERIEAVLAEG
jgi:hypothetical protein